MSNMQWKKAPAFHEIAEALGCDTVNIMAALVTPTGIMALYAPEPDDVDPMIYSAIIRKDADGILTAGPRREVELTSTFIQRMDIQIGARLEEEFGPPGSPIPPYDEPHVDEDPEERDEECAHMATGNGFVYRCDLPAGHTGMHRQRTQLRGSVSTTNWGDDGLAPHATKYPENGTYGGSR